MELAVGCEVLSGQQVQADAAGRGLMGASRALGETATQAVGNEREARVRGRPVTQNESAAVRHALRRDAAETIIFAQTEGIKK